MRKNKVKKLVGQDEDSSISEGKRKKWNKRNHRLNDAQPASEQPLWKPIKNPSQKKTKQTKTFFLCLRFCCWAWYYMAWNIPSVSLGQLSRLCPLRASCLLWAAMKKVNSIPDRPSTLFNISSQWMWRQCQKARRIQGQNFLIGPSRLEKLHPLPCYFMMYLICSISEFHNSAFLSQFSNNIQNRSQYFFDDKQQVLHNEPWIQHTTFSGAN